MCTEFGPIAELNLEIFIPMLISQTTQYQAYNAP